MLGGPVFTDPMLSGPMFSGPAVVKLGGSFAFSPHLRNWVRAIAGCGGRMVIVPGGGVFADAVRTAQVKMGFDDRAAHRMGLLAMEQYGCAIESLDDRLSLADSLDLIQHGLADNRIPVWLPTRMALSAADIAHSWDVTSDSLAAWLAGKIGAAQLVYIKHVKGDEKTMRAADLAACGVMDKAFANVLAASGVPAFMLGPEDHGALARCLSGETAGTRIIA